MANYTLNRTGAQIDAILDRADRKFKKLHTETADGTTNFIRFTADYNVRFTLWLQNDAGAWKTTKASTPGALQNATAARYTETRWYNRCGRWQCECTTNASAEVAGVAYRSAGDTSGEVGTVTSIKAVLVYIYGSGVKIPAGTTFEFWGR